MIKIEGDPIVYLCIEPATSRLSLRVPHLRGALPDLSGYQHLSAAVVHWNDAAWFELRSQADPPRCVSAPVPRRG